MTTSNLKIRPAIPADLAGLQDLFTETVKSTCSEDYTPDQIEVWLSATEDQDRWLNKMKDQYFLIAESETEIVGFASLENGDYLDFLYVHKNHLRKGIAGLLYEEIAKEAIRSGAMQLRADVSITAKPFFERKGFTVEKENHLKINGVEISNYRMIKDKKD